MPGPQDILGPRRLEHVYSTRSETEFKDLISQYRSRPNVVAEGDSWFAYPRSFLAFGAPNNVIDHIKKLKRFNLLQLSSNGDEAVDMLTGSSKLKLIKILNRHSVDFLLFSGGGNDVVGRFDFEFFLNDNVTADTWKPYVNMTRLKRRLSQVKNAYEDLIGFCDEYSKNENIKIVTHTYDYLVPDPQGAVFIGGLLQIDDGQSWIYPYLMNKKVPKKFHRKIVDYLINEMAKILLDVQSSNPNRIIVADTRGTLDPDTDWLNEIHPTPDGFAKVTQKIFDAMKPYF